MRLYICYSQINTMRLIASLLLIALTATIGCRPKGDCDPERACTMEFRTIGIEVRDTAFAPYALDSTFTVKASTGEIIHVENHSMYPGHYGILTDSEMELTTTMGESFTFKGYRNGELKVSEPFLIRHDCCHIILVAGNTYVIVND